MKALLTDKNMPDVELVLTDNGHADPTELELLIGDRFVTVDIVELYRSLMPFMGKLTPEQVGQRQL